MFAESCACSWKWATWAEAKGGVRWESSWHFGLRSVEDVESAHCSPAGIPGIHRETHLEVWFFRFLFSFCILVCALHVSICREPVDIVALPFEHHTSTSYGSAANFCSHEPSRLGSHAGWQAHCCCGQHGRQLGAFSRFRGNSLFSWPLLVFSAVFWSQCRRHRIMQSAGTRGRITAACFLCPGTNSSSFCVSQGLRRCVLSFNNPRMSTPPPWYLGPLSCIDISAI